MKRLALALSALGLAALLAIPAMAIPAQHFTASLAGTTNYLYTPTSPLSAFNITLNGAGGYVTLYWYRDKLTQLITDSLEVRVSDGVPADYPYTPPITPPIYKFRINRDNIVAEVLIRGGSG